MASIPVLPLVRCIAASFLAVAIAGALVRAQPRVLTQAIEVRSLSVAEAETGVPVRLRGIVVFVEHPSSIFVQDETSTTFFRTEQKPFPAIGDEIELTGKTRMGLYLPGLDHSRFQILGKRPLPPGIPARYDDLASGRYHYQRVAVQGIVRAVLPLETNRSLMRLAMGSRVIEVRVETPPPPGRSLVDHHVRVTGLAAGLINTARRQLVQPYLRVLDWEEIEVLKPAPPVAEVSQISVEQLLAFRVTGHGEQRVRIDGVVTATFPDMLFLRQGALPFAVRLIKPVALEPGERVTVVGFPAMERFSASVVDAELVERASGPPLEPVDVKSLDALYGRSPDAGKHDCDLVRVEVTLRDVFKADQGLALVVQDGERTIEARFPDGVTAPEPGSRLRLTGICQVESAAFAAGFASRPGVISLHGRSPADLEILRLPPWWTPRRLTNVLAALAGVTLLAGLWITVLRRQVSRQTAALRRGIETEAALEERQRIAREFHDTLEQELAGVTLRLDALTTRELDEKGRSLVTASRSLVSRIQSETRDLISDLRDPDEAAGDVGSVLSRLAARRSADTGVAIDFVAATPLPLLPAAIVHDLRMIARESVTNALKHGRATRVRIEVAHRDTLALKIADNGTGFDPAAALAGKRGHFGCAGIRERSRKIGATVTWHSSPQTGTTVEVHLPLGNPDRQRTAPARRHEPQWEDLAPSATGSPPATPSPARSTHP